MQTCTIVERVPTAGEYNRLREAVGWGRYKDEVIDAFLPGSLYCVCAIIGEEVIGMARVIGDGGLVFYIQDVVVAPEYQRQGIGSRLMDNIMAYLAAHSHHNTILGLMAAEGKEPFYEKYGFQRRPDWKYGAGMTLFWGENDG